MRTHVEKRAKNRYTIVIDKGRDPLTQKRDQEYIPTEITEKKKAEKEAARILLEYERGFEPSKLTFGQYLLVWLEDYVAKKLSKRTYSDYKKIIDKHTIPKLGSISLIKLSPLHLQKYYNALQENGSRLDGKSGGLSEATIWKHHCVIHKAFKTAVKNSQTSSN